jgi:hypothetical protein
MMKSSTKYVNGTFITVESTFFNFQVKSYRSKNYYRTRILYENLIVAYCKKILRKIFSYKNLENYSNKILLLELTVFNCQTKSNRGKNQEVLHSPLLHQDLL